MIQDLLTWVSDLERWQQVLLALFIFTSWETAGFFPLTWVRCQACRRRIWRWRKVCSRCTN